MSSFMWEGLSSWMHKLTFISGHLHCHSIYFWVIIQAVGLFHSKTEDFDPQEISKNQINPSWGRVLWGLKTYQFLLILRKFVISDLLKTRWYWSILSFTSTRWVICKVLKIFSLSSMTSRRLLTRQANQIKSILNFFVKKNNPSPFYPKSCSPVSLHCK